jgi:hypothetical protein
MLADAMPSLERECDDRAAGTGDGDRGTTLDAWRAPDGRRREMLLLGATRRA